MNTPDSTLSMAAEHQPVATWRDRLYQSYVSSGQAAETASHSEPFRLRDYPYLCQRIPPQLPESRSARILDLGCGHGGLLYCLKEWGYKNVAGVDVSEQQVSLAHQKGLSEVARGDLYRFLDEQTAPANVIFLMDVIEHLNREEMFKLLDSVHRSLSPDGKLILHLPNASGIFGMSVRYGDITHEQAYAARGIEQCLSVCGFENITIYEDKPVVYGVKSLVRRVVWNALTAPVRLLYAAESGHFPVALSQNVLVTAEAKHASDLNLCLRAA
ncbi:class I SAM-dependent methyltransferase [Fuerstiella marisgermanici]|nr:class I SAM-dependent methyltransferase [Fuerstiella marisgermanici]